MQETAILKYQAFRSMGIVYLSIFQVCLNWLWQHLWFSAYKYYSSSVRLILKYCKFHLVGFCIFLYAYKYLEPLFWNIAKLLGNWKWFDSFGVCRKALLGRTRAALSPRLIFSLPAKWNPSEYSTLCLMNYDIFYSLYEHLIFLVLSEILRASRWFFPGYRELPTCTGHY